MKTDFESELERGLNQVCGFVYHPSDIVGFTHTPKKPVDFLCSFHGCFMAVEAKATTASRFPFRDIPEHQRKTLTVAGYETRGSSWLSLDFRDDNGPGRAWFVPWAEWLLMETCIGRKSITRAIISEMWPEWELIWNQEKEAWELPLMVTEYLIRLATFPIPDKS